MNKRLSEMKIAQLVFFSIFGFFLLSIFFNRCTASKYASLPISFIIPYGYEGRLRIIYDEKYGTSAEIKNNRQFFYFDKQGMLMANLRENAGFDAKDKFYYIDSNRNNL
jgi:hypothetical protein